jgi:vitamin B12 transporter
MKRWSFLACCLRPAVACLAIAAPAVPAAEAVPTDQALVDEELVVTATRLPLPVDEVLAPTLVINRDAIELSGAGDPGDILRFHAGLDLGRNGGPGQTTAIFIRGANSNQTLVMVDGVRINPGTIGLGALQNVAPSTIERIEVVKGPRSALWGTDAIGGVINVITRREASDSWTADVGYGAYDTEQASLNGGTSLGRAQLGLGVAWIDSQGFPTRSDDNVDRGFHNLSGTASLRGDVGPANVVLRYWRAGGTTEYSDYFLAPVNQDFADSTLSLQVAVPLRDTLSANFTASHFTDSIDQNQSTDYLRTRRDTVDAELDWRPASQTWSTGAMVTQEHASSRSYGDQFDTDTQAVNLYVQDQLEIGPHRALAAVGYTDHETAGNAWTWNLEYGYTLAGATLLYALGGTGYRVPDATDRYGYGGNPDLKPERSFDLEAGIRHRVSGAQALSLSWFRNEINDLIVWVADPNDPYSGQLQNVDRARIEGVEAAWEYVSGPWQARVEAIHQDPRNLTTGERLLRRAENSLTATLTRTVGTLDFGADVLATGDRKDYGYPKPVTLSSYVLLNLVARWHTTPAMTVSARLENALNQQYELADNFNTPDRGLYVSLSYAMGASRQAARVAEERGRDSQAPRGAYSAPIGAMRMGL